MSRNSFYTYVHISTTSCHPHGVQGLDWVTSGGSGKTGKAGRGGGFKEGVGLWKAIYNYKFKGSTVLIERCNS